MLANITDHWKTTVAGLLTAAVAVAGVLVQQGVYAKESGIVAAIASALLGVIARDPGKESQ